MQTPGAYTPLSTSAGSVPERIIIKEGLFFHGHLLDTIERACRQRLRERPARLGIALGGAGSAEQGAGKRKRPLPFSKKILQ